MSKKEILIVGGGYGGAYLANKLLNESVGNTRFVEPKESSFHCIGALRTSVDDSYSNKLCIPFCGNLAKAHIQAKAIELDVDSKQITLNNGKTINYTDLVIATGSDSTFPGKLGINNSTYSNEDILQKYSEFRQQIMASKKVVIVGGGAVGLEMAGEIKTDFPEKQVIIISSSDALVTKRATPPFQNAVLTMLKEKDIDLRLNERVTNLNELSLNKHEDGLVVKTSSGPDILCDLVVTCVGTKINNQFFKSSLADAMDDAGALRVNEYLEVKGHDRVYAIGDVNDVEEEKMAKNAIEQAETLFKTLSSEPTKYEPDRSLVMLLPIGRDGGVGIRNGTLMDRDSVRDYKCKDLFANKIWGSLGVTPPD